jgi:hypothetical protein
MLPAPSWCVLDNGQIERYEIMLMASDHVSITRLGKIQPRRCTGVKAEISESSKLETFVDGPPLHHRRSLLRFSRFRLATAATVDRLVSQMVTAIEDAAVETTPFIIPGGRKSAFFVCLVCRKNSRLIKSSLTCQECHLNSHLRCVNPEDINNWTCGTCFPAAAAAARHLTPLFFLGIP